MIFFWEEKKSSLLLNKIEIRLLFTHHDLQSYSAPQNYSATATTSLSSQRNLYHQTFLSSPTHTFHPQPFWTICISNTLLWSQHFFTILNFLVSLSTISGHFQQIYHPKLTSIISHTFPPFQHSPNTFSTSLLTWCVRAEAAATQIESM